VLENSIKKLAAVNLEAASAPKPIFLDDDNPYRGGTSIMGYNNAGGYGADRIGGGFSGCESPWKILTGPYEPQLRTKVKEYGWVALLAQLRLSTRMGKVLWGLWWLGQGV